jgi:hypothetical protein
MVALFEAFVLSSEPGHQLKVIRQNQFPFLKNTENRFGFLLSGIFVC